MSAGEITVSQAAPTLYSACDTAPAAVEPLISP